MSNRETSRQGFTLVELMIVVTTIAILAAIAIPNMVSARLHANETAAIATLRRVSSAQAQFHSAKQVDVDLDGQGEYGLIRELTGATVLREAPDGTGSTKTLAPTVLSRGLAGVDANGWVKRSGYRVRVWLQGTNASAIGEGGLTGLAGGGSAISTDWAETVWCAYARPTNYGASGNRTFFVNQQGDLTAKDDEQAEISVDAGAAFAAGGFLHGITGQVALGTVGRDGQMWVAVR